MNAVVQFPRPGQAPDELLPESRILELRPLLALGTLRGARKTEKIRWSRGKRGTAWYRLVDVDAFIAEFLERTPCRDQGHDPSLNSEGSGSQSNQAPETSTVSGMTPALEEHAARALALQI